MCRYSCLMAPVSVVCKPATRSIQPCFFLATFCPGGSAGFSSPSISFTNLIRGMSGGSGHTSLLVSIKLWSINVDFLTCGACCCSFFFLACPYGARANTSAEIASQMVIGFNFVVAISIPHIIELGPQCFPCGSYGRIPGRVSDLSPALPVLHRHGAGGNSGS